MRRYELVCVFSLHFSCVSIGCGASMADVGRARVNRALLVPCDLDWLEHFLD